MFPNTDHAGSSTRIFERYLLGPKIASGSMGTVFNAFDQRTGQAVVVKVFDDIEHADRHWVDEMRLAMRLNSPHIIRCLDLGRDERLDRHALVYERAAGGSLRRALVAGRSFTAQEVRRVLSEVGQALAYAHSQGIVHRDVKPENILARSSQPDSSWALTDFGAGRYLRRNEFASTLAGSTAYLPPETTSGRTDHSSDQYSWALVGIELLTRQLPTPAGRRAWVLEHLHRSSLEGVLARAASATPQRRFPAMQHALAALNSEEALLVGETEDALGTRYCFLGSSLLVCRYAGQWQTLEHKAPHTLDFVSFRGADRVLLRSRRKLHALSEAGLRTLVASEEPLQWAAADSQANRIIYQAGESLCLLDANGERIAELPSPLPPTMWEEGSRLCAGFIDEQTVFVAGVGSTRAYFLKVQPEQAIVTEVTLPYPVREAYRQQEYLYLLCGDAQTTALVSLEGSSFRVQATFTENFDQVVLTWRKRNLTMSILPVIEPLDE